LRFVLRFLAFQSLMVWQGGFVFYALVVVPVGSGLRGETAQGFLTRQVVPWLAVVTWIALSLGAAEILTCRPRRRPRLSLWIAAALLQLLLHDLYARVDAQLDPVQETIRDYSRFYTAHAYYLCTAGVQWALLLVASGLSLYAWQSPHQGRP
jgi:hypothetical protein